MRAVAGDEEVSLLERIVRYREEYRQQRAAALSEERERRHLEGSVYVAGFWVPRDEVARLDRGVRQHERVALLEIVFFFLLLCLFALLLWFVFRLMLLP